MPHMLIQDIIGPVMVGPSSSHTAGALAISAMARKLIGETPAKATFKLYGSFAHTYWGHGTDRALIAGLLGLATDDLGIRDAFKLAEDAGMEVEILPCPDDDYEHPNTVDIIAVDKSGVESSFRGVSIGGGAAKLTHIDGLRVEITGKSNNLVVRQHDEKGVLAFITTTLLTEDINIANANLYRTSKGGQAFTVIETDEPMPKETARILEAHSAIFSAKVIPAVEPAPHKSGAVVSGADQERANELYHSYDFKTGASLLERCAETGLPISEVFLRRNRFLLERDGLMDDTLPYLKHCLSVMRESVHEPLEHPVPSIGKLLGGEAAKVRDSVRGRQEEPGMTLVNKMIEYALAVLETNSSMGRIVAAPTAGSAGVIPAVLIALQEERQLEDLQMTRALGTAAAVGYLIARNASVSGAEGGCQAEIGSASAMAAAAITELYGGSPEECLNAASNAISSLLGLVCDPIGGLVEVPCQKRNATAATTALVSAQIALAGIDNLVDFDQTVEAMRQVGMSLPFELRESGLGGMAGTPSACAFCQSMSCGKL